MCRASWPCASGSALGGVRSDECRLEVQGQGRWLGRIAEPRPGRRGRAGRPASVRLVASSPDGFLGAAGRRADRGRPPGAGVTPSGRGGELGGGPDGGPGTAQLLSFGSVARAALREPRCHSPSVPKPVSKEPSRSRAGNWGCSPRTCSAHTPDSGGRGTPAAPARSQCAAGPWAQGDPEDG